jgi:hypothetical protein
MTSVIFETRNKNKNNNNNGDDEDPNSKLLEMVTPVFREIERCDECNKKHLIYDLVILGAFDDRKAPLLCSECYEQVGSRYLSMLKKRERTSEK